MEVAGEDMVCSAKLARRPNPVNLSSLPRSPRSPRYFRNPENHTFLHPSLREQGASNPYFHTPTTRRKRKGQVTKRPNKTSLSTTDPDRDRLLHANRTSTCPLRDRLLRPI